MQRRIGKTYKGQTTRFVWDGNTPLHEWVETPERPLSQAERTTWVFGADSFIPAAKLVGDRSYSIISDYLGTPQQAYDASGTKVWSAVLAGYGLVKESQDKAFIPFRYQGQYEDTETGLYYNRFRYYSPEEGRYISQDPIRLNGGFELYNYVTDTNDWLDVFGLSCTKDLKKNMNQANQELRQQTGSMKRAWHSEKGSAAHHIIPGDDYRAERARDILAKHGIGINDAENGIYLKHIDPNSKQPGAYHREIHTKKYYKTINKLIERADQRGSKQGVLDAMQRLQDRLLFNDTTLWK